MDLSVRYDPTKDAYCATFTCSDIEPSSAVVFAVSELRDMKPTELDPLHNVIDPEALDLLFKNKENPQGTIEFDYEDCEISVHKSGEIYITRRDTVQAAV